MQNFEKSLSDLLPSDLPPGLRTAIEYSLLGPGKRIRPKLVFASAQLFELPVDAITRAAVAIEMLHCFTLIHDDLPCMDDDDERRGRPSNHKAFGENIALLAGDALTAIPFQVVSEITSVPATQVLKSTQAISSAITAVIGGQALELTLLDQPSRPHTEAVHELKTARLFECSVALPAYLAAASPEMTTALQNFGRTLGLAFQALDDLDDAENEDPVSLLHFVKPTEIRKIYTEKLQQAMQSLQKLKNSNELLQIGQTLLDRLAHG